MIKQIYFTHKFVFQSDESVEYTEFISEEG